MTCVVRRVGLSVAVGILVAFASAALQGCGGRPPATASGSGIHDGSQLALALDDYMSRLPALDVSGALLVAKDGKIVLSKGYGLADREKNKPYTNATVFSTGSITKQFTAAAIMKLQEAGRLSVDDTLDKFFDDVPDDKARISLHHLLTHTSGLEPFLGDDFDTTATRAWIIRAALGSELSSLPGERYEYSNVGYSLLAAVIEIVSERSYEEFLVEEILKPAGLTRTGYTIPDWSGMTIAQGYEGDEPWGTVLDKPWLADGPGWNLRGNGGIHSTLVDMYRWHQALLGDRVLNAASRERMFTPFADEGGGESHYGYGWSIATTPRNTKVIAHNGGNQVFFADVRRYVDEDVVLIFATNTASAGAEWVSEIVPSIIFGEDYVVPPKIARIDPERARSLAGEYALPSGEIVAITADDEGRLSLAAIGEAFCLITSGETHQHPHLDHLARHTSEMIGGAIRSELGPIERALEGEIPREEIAGIFKERRATWTGEHGEYRSTSPVAAVPEEDGEVVVIARSDFARGAIHHRVRWSGPRIVGARLTFDPEVTFYPESETGFASFGFTEKRSVRISFEPATNAQGGALIVHGPRNSTTLTRVNQG